MNQPDWYEEFQKYNPLRLLNWRWYEAVHLTETRKRRHKDSQVATIAEFLRDRLKGSPRKGANRSYTPPTGLAESLCLWQSGGEKRVDLEAYLLIEDQTIEQIAARFGLPPETVHWYEAAFFNVRDRLEAKDWVAAQAIPGRNRIEPPGLGYGPTLRYYAYHGGVKLLETVIAVLRRQQFPQMILDTFEYDPLYEASRLRIMVALHVHSLWARSEREIAQLIRIYRKAAKIDKKQGRVPAVMQGDTVSMIGRFFSTISKKRPRLKKSQNPKETQWEEIKNKVREALDPTTANLITPPRERPQILPTEESLSKILNPRLRSSGLHEREFDHVENEKVPVRLL